MPCSLWLAMYCNSSARGVVTDEGLDYNTSHMHKYVNATDIQLIHSVRG